MSSAITFPVFIYDGDCGVCQGFVGLLDRGTLGNIRMVPFQSLDLASYGLSEVEAKKSAFFVSETKIYNKSDSIAMALKDQRNYLLRFIGMALQATPIRPLARLGYTVFAKNRNLLPGAKICYIEDKAQDISQGRQELNGLNLNS